MNVPFSPFATTTAGGSFGASSTGYIQGVAVDNPVSNQFISAGVLASTETLPMWGGVAVSALIPAAGNALGSVTRAAALADITGFSVYNKNGSMASSPQSPAPVTTTGGQVNFCPLGSNTQIPLAIDAGLAATLASGTAPANTQVSWDFTLQKIVAYSALLGVLPVKINAVDVANSLGVTYDAVAGTCVFTSGAAVALVTI